MAAGRPVIANVPLDGDMKKFIEKANCGIAIQSAHPQDLVEEFKKYMTCLKN